MFLIAFLAWFSFSSEKLIYNLYLGPLRAGELKLSCERGFFQGESVYLLSSTLKSNFPFKISDSLSSIVRMSDWTTLKSYKKVSEGRYKKEIAYEFTEEKVEYSDGTSFFCPAPPKDLLTLWYYLRSLSGMVGSNGSVETFAHLDKKNYQVKIDFKERVILSTPLGSFTAHRLEPKTRPKSILGDIYISNDSLCLPLIIRTKLLFGLVKGVIKNQEVK